MRRTLWVAPLAVAVVAAALFALSSTDAVALASGGGREG
jgi:hypothetical protein